MPSYNDAAWSSPDDGYPDDWIRPPAIDSGIDDWVRPGEWFTPPQVSIPGAAPQTDLSRLQAGTVPSSGSSDVWNDPGSIPGLGPPSPLKPGPFAAFFSMIPASRLGVQAWAPPIFPDSFGKFPQPPPLELPLEIGGRGILGGIAKMLADQKAAANDPWAAARNTIVGQFADPPLGADGLPANFGEGGILGALKHLPPSDASTQAVRGFIGDPQAFLLPNAGGYQGLDPNSLVRLVADHSGALPPGERDLDKEPQEDGFRRKVDIPSQTGLNLPGVGSVLPLPLGRLGPPPSSAAPRGGAPAPQAQPSPRPSPAAPNVLAEPAPSSGPTGAPRTASGPSGVSSPAPGLSDLAELRSRLGLKEGEGTLARLDIGGRSFYGINAHGQPTTLNVNAISASHAETDAFQQAANAGISGGEGFLFVDRRLCAACGIRGQVKSLARQLGLSKLTVVSPGGTTDLSP